jgi:hypothetical protein
MADMTSAKLRIQGTGDVPVNHVHKFLSDLENAYNSILMYELLLDRVAKAQTPGFLVSQSLPVDLSPLAIRAFVPAGSGLVLYGVTLQSPGFWEFLGKLNPLEVIRLYLIDRDERRQRKEFRDNAEKEKLELENALLKVELYSKQVDVIKKMGATPEDFAFLRNRLIHDPLEPLGRSQDRGLISSAQFVKEKVAA